MNPEQHNSESEIKEGEVAELSSLELGKIANDVRNLVMKEGLSEKRAFERVAIASGLYHGRTEIEVERIHDLVTDTLNNSVIKKVAAHGAKEKSLGWLTEWQNRHDQ